LFNVLRSIQFFRETLTQIDVRERDFTKQNQSPDTPKIYYWVEFNSNYLSKSELIYFCFLCYFLKESKRQRLLTWYLRSTLPEKLLKATYLSSEERMQLTFLVQKKGVKVSLDHCIPFSPRRVLGLLNNPEVTRKVLSRIYIKRRPRKYVAPQQFIRGYRDHGTLRKPHLWLPESDISLTEKQNEIEEARERELMLEQFALSGEFPHMIQHFLNGEKT